MARRGEKVLRDPTESLFARAIVIAQAILLFVIIILLLWRFAFSQINLQSRKKLVARPMPCRGNNRRFPRDE